jgi:acyl transferase domain-containing protein
MPSEHAQVANIKRAYCMAGLQVSDTNYVECHGTGTKQGDNHEAKAISMSFAKSNKAPVYIGSVKTNIGHSEAAAGVAGLIKATLALERGQVPQHLNYTKQSPDIPLEDWNMKIPLERIPWPSEIRRASVNSFGFGGANAHVIVDGAAQYLQANDLENIHHSTSAEHQAQNMPSAGKELKSRSSQLFIYSAQDGSSLQTMIKDHATHLKGLAGNGNLLTDYSYTLNSRRSRFEHMISLIADSKGSLLSQLDEVDNLKVTQVSSRKAKPNVRYVFCGQGSCRPGMFGGLRSLPPFRQSVDASLEILQQIAPDVDFAAAMSSQEQAVFDSPVVAQVATTTFQIALADLLAASGIDPVAVAGHSSGEIAAAYAARIIDRKTALQLAYLRGEAATSAPSGGGMLAASVSVETALDLLDRTEVSDSVTIGCINSPSSVTFSGAAIDLDQLAKRLRAQTSHKIRHTTLKIPIAYHSSYMMGPAKTYLESLPSYTLQTTSSIRMFSSVTGEEVFASDLTPTYWEKSLYSPVLFDSALTAMMTDVSATATDILIELSPTSILQTPISETLLSAGFAPGQVKQLSMKDEPGDRLQAMALSMLSELILSGLPVNMDWMVRLDGSRPKCLSDLPPYPWNHSKTYWHESQDSFNRRNRSHGREDLIGAPATQLMDLEPRWTGFFRLHENPWIKDHQVQRLIMYPAAGMVVMALEGAKQLSESMAPHAQLYSFEVFDVDIMAPMLIPSTQRGLGHTLSAQRLSSATPDSGALDFSFSIYSCLDGSEWQKNAKGAFRIMTSPQWQSLQDCLAPDNILDLCLGGAKPHHLYERLEGMGMKYGPSFRAVTSTGAVKITSSSRSCWVHLEIPRTAKIMPFEYEHGHIIHPATLDAIIHSVFALSDKPRMPVHIKSVQVASDFPKTQGSELFAHCSAVGIGTATVTADVAVYNAPGAAPILQVRGLQLAPLPSAADSGFLPNYRNLCSTVEWNVDPVEHLPEDTAENFLGWFKLLLLKKPDLQVLFAVDNVDLAKQMLGLIAGEVAYAITCSRFTFMGVAQQIHTAVMNDASPQFKAVLPILEAREGVTEMADLVSTYDVAVVDAAQIQKFKQFVKPGSFLYEQQSQTVIANDIPFVKIENNVKLLVVVLVTEKLKVSAQYAAFSALIFEALRTEFHNSEVFLTTNLHLEQFQADEIHVVSFLDLDDSRDVSVNADEYLATQKLLLSKSYKSMLWATRGAQLDCSKPKAAATVGIIRTIRSEEPSQKITCFDLDANDESKSLSEDHLILVLKDCIHHARAKAGRTPVLPGLEAEYAVKNGILHFQRLKPMVSLNRLIESDEDDFASKDTCFSPQLRNDATYLIVGGLGGLGRQVAGRLVARGARHLCFVSRRTAPSGDDLKALARSFDENVIVKAYQADVCDPSHLRKVLHRMKIECPPLKGVVQAAAVLKVSDSRSHFKTTPLWQAD